MFERLFDKASTVIHHKLAPYAVERERYLVHYEKEGYTRGHLKQIAGILLPVVYELKDCPDLKAGEEQIQAATQRAARMQSEYSKAGNVQNFREMFEREAKRWLRFLGRFQEPSPEPLPFADLLVDFAAWMERERGLAVSTIELRCRCTEQFLFWFAKKQRPISSIRLTDVDSFLTSCHTKGWSRVTVKIQANAIRSFLRHAALRGWCSSTIAEAIHGPRIYTDEDIPSGPSWDEVKRLLSGLETDRAADIRDRAIILLCAVYGFRAFEVSRLRLEDIDWEHDQISVPRPKQRRSQLYPRAPEVGQAIIRYLKEVRPKCAYREIFMTLLAPVRPVARKNIYAVVANRMNRLGIKSLPHQGPHALRHACATHLLAEGHSLKEIGDHLGHGSSRSTRIYAKVDLQALRKVADFDLGGVL